MSGSDAGTMRSRAVRDGRRLRHQRAQVVGHQRPGGGLHRVFTMTDPEKKHRGVTAFLIDTNKPGLCARQERAQAGHPRLGHQRDRVRRLPLPAENRLGEEGEGFKIAMTVLDAGRIGIAAQALGIAEAAYEASAASTPASARPSGRRSANSRASPSSWPI
jgi:alkylation response protein AidB-like acyl-CoA dehydrogenase